VTPRHVIIGMGPAAIAAAETIRAMDSGAPITLVASEIHGYYSRPGLAYFLANEVTEKGLFPMTAEEFARLRLDLVHDRAVRIDTSSHEVQLASGAALPYDRLLIATGSTAIPLRVPGFDLDGVVKLDDLDDARDIIRRGRMAKAAVVVGGGITALEIVEGLRDHKVHVHYLMRRERYWGNVLSVTESQAVEEGLRSRGVEIHYFSEIAAVLGEGGKVSSVQLTDGSAIRCDMVAVAIGVRANIGLAIDSGLTCERGVLVDEHLRSSDPDVFVAGDVAEVCDAITDRRTIEVLWSSAVEKGRIAGANMVEDAAHVYAKGAPLNVTRLAGSKITIIGTVGEGNDSDLEGLARGDSETWRRLGASTHVEWRDGENRVRLALADDVIAGAIVMGDQALSFPLQELVTSSADVRPIAAALILPGADVPALVDRLWREHGGRNA
jgi:NAD(P)H-nitrite reductase large subunit